MRAPHSFTLIAGLFGLAAATTSSADTVGYANDAAFLASDFATAWVAESRWGNNALAGDWEIGLVNATNTATYAQSNFVWTSHADHTVSLNYATGTSTATYTAAGQLVSASGLPQPTNGINALAVRARAADGDVANVGPLTVSFASGGAAMLFQLVGDADAEYLVLIDDRLASGFSVSGGATLTDGRGSLPSYQFKVGYATPVPVPAAALLLLSGLSGLGFVCRQRPNGRKARSDL